MPRITQLLAAAPVVMLPPPRLALRSSVSRLKMGTSRGGALSAAAAAPDEDNNRDEDDEVEDRSLSYDVEAGPLAFMNSTLLVLFFDALV